MRTQHVAQRAPLRAFAHAVRTLFGRVCNRSPAAEDRDLAAWKHLLKGVLYNPRRGRNVGRDKWDQPQPARGAGCCTRQDLPGASKAAQVRRALGGRTEGGQKADHPLVHGTLQGDLLDVKFRTGADVAPRGPDQSQGSRSKGSLRRPTGGQEALPPVRFRVPAGDTQYMRTSESGFGLLDRRSVAAARERSAGSCAAAGKGQTLPPGRRWCEGA